MNYWDEEVLDIRRKYGKTNYAYTQKILSLILHR
jgi:hypothetical protein